MAFNLDTVKNLFKNKWALAGVVGVAGVGAFALYQRKKSTGSSLQNSASTGTQDATAGTVLPYGSGFMDTSTNDMASWLSQWGGQFSNQLQDQTKSITDAISGLNANGGGTTTTPTQQPTGAHPYLTSTGDTWATVAQKLFGDSSLAGALKGYNRANTTYAGPNPNNKYAGGTTFSYHTVLAVPYSAADLKNYSYVPG